MAALLDLPNEVILIIWHIVAVRDVCIFSTASKNIYHPSRELLTEHHRLMRKYSKISNKGADGGVFAEALKEILTNPRAALYPSILEVEGWYMEWEEPNPAETDKKMYSEAPQSDLDLFDKATRCTDPFETNIVDSIEQMRLRNEEPLIALLLKALAQSY